jgi:hypothetical protein
MRWRVSRLFSFTLNNLFELLEATIKMGELVHQNRLPLLDTHHSVA